MPRKPLVSIGKRYGRLVTTRKDGQYYICDCDCGNTARARSDRLHSGAKRSCGCLLAESRVSTDNKKHTHGMTYSEEYGIWASMIARCKGSDKSKERYWGRGITVCQSWTESFEAFFADMGPRPSPLHSIDRINNDGNYEPGNCRWTTADVQQFNKGLCSHNTTGVRGVSYNRTRGKWSVSSTINRKPVHIYFGSDFFEAVCARKSYELNRIRQSAKQSKSGEK